MHRYEATIWRYLDACNAGDFKALVDCFTPDAVHYFPPGLPDVPWRGAETIAAKWVWCVENLGSQWTVERLLLSDRSDEAVSEWTHWKRNTNTAQRGDEWYLFDPNDCRIKEIRAYYAAPAVTQAQDLPKVQGIGMGELVGFDYSGRGYHLCAK